MQAFFTIRFDTSRFLSALFALALSLTLFLGAATPAAQAQEVQPATPPAVEPAKPSVTPVPAIGTVPLTSEQQQKVNAARAGQCPDGSCQPKTAGTPRPVGRSWGGCSAGAGCVQAGAEQQRRQGPVRRLISRLRSRRGC